MDNILSYLIEEKQAKRQGGLYHKTQVNLAYTPTVLKVVGLRRSKHAIFLKREL
jgi:hypothetical protein